MKKCPICKENHTNPDPISLCTSCEDDCHRYLDKLEKLCEWLETRDHKSSYDKFEVEKIITRKELADKRYTFLRKDVVFWNTGWGWSRRVAWQQALKEKRAMIRQSESLVS